MIEKTGKREVNRAKRRAAIVEIATQAFFEHGYAATSMSGIADALGGSKATLWAHFSSKEELFVAVVDALVDRFAADIEETLVSQRFSPNAMRRFCIRFLECLFETQSQQLFRLVVAEGERFPEIRDVFHMRGPAKMSLHTAQFFETAFAPAEAERLAQLTLATILGYRTQALIRGEIPSRSQIEDFVDCHIAHLQLPPQNI